MVDTTNDAGSTIIETSTDTAQSECNGLLCCPDCGGELIYYHSLFKYGDGVTRIVCRKKCNGWKILREVDRNKLKT